MTQTVRLSEAVERFRQEAGAYSNAYDWYRRDAQRSGSVYIGGVRIPAYKTGRSWQVNEEDLARALAGHRQAITRRRDVTQDYDNHVLHGRPGDVVEMDWGYYRIAKGFHCVSRKFTTEPAGPGTWYCSRCWRLAESEHDREECHTCSDWGGCGGDCTLSRVYCSVCGESMSMVGA